MNNVFNDSTLFRLRRTNFKPLLTEDGMAARLAWCVAARASRRLHGDNRVVYCDRDEAYFHCVTGARCCVCTMTTTRRFVACANTCIRQHEHCAGADVVNDDDDEDEEEGLGLSTLSSDARAVAVDGRTLFISKIRRRVAPPARAQVVR